jgi:hypothetical protein
VNLDRREYIDPAAFRDGGGLLEFGSSGSGTMLGLAILLASGTTGGPKEPRSKSALVGSWAEHRLVICGDSDQTIFTELRTIELRSLPIGPSLYEVARMLYTDISSAVIGVLAEEPYERRALENRGVALTREKSTP